MGHRHNHIETFMISRRVLLSGMALSVSAPSLLYAHGFHVSFSVLEFNARTGSLEIFHRIFIQDFELALAAQSSAQNGEAITLHETPETEKMVRDYLAEKFSVSTAEGTPLKPEWVGLQLKVDTMFVYQEVKNVGDVAGLVIQDQILTETHPTQLNTVNITREGRTQTLTFTADTASQTVRF